jgi:hypothetical protein
MQARERGRRERARYGGGAGPARSPVARALCFSQNHMGKQQRRICVSQSFSQSACDALEAPATVPANRVGHGAGRRLSGSLLSIEEQFVQLQWYALRGGAWRTRSCPVTR